MQTLERVGVAIVMKRGEGRKRIRAKSWTEMEFPDAIFITNTGCNGKDSCKRIISQMISNTPVNQIIVITSTKALSIAQDIQKMVKNKEVVIVNFDIIAKNLGIEI